MQVILGVLFHFIGGFASGSFYIPYKKVRGWHWESYWIVGGLFSWLIVPPLAAWLTIPGFAEIIKTTGVSTLFLTFFFWFAVGNWWPDLWTGRSLSRCIAWQQYHTWFMYGIRCPDTFYIL